MTVLTLKDIGEEIENIGLRPTKKRREVPKETVLKEIENARQGIFAAGTRNNNGDTLRSDDDDLDRWLTNEGFNKVRPVSDEEHSATMNDNAEWWAELASQED